MNDINRKMFIVPHAGYPFDVLVAVGVPDAQLEKKLAAHGVTVDDDCRAAIAMHGRGRTAQLTTGGQTVLRLASWNGTPAPVEVGEKWLSDVPHLARLGIAGKTEDCRMLARRMAKNARKAGRAELADSLAAMAGAGSPLRAASAPDERGRTIAESPGTSTPDQASRE